MGYSCQKTPLAKERAFKTEIYWMQHKLTRTTAQILLFLLTFLFVLAYYGNSDQHLLKGGHEEFH